MNQPKQSDDDKVKQPVHVPVTKEAEAEQEVLDPELQAPGLADETNTQA